VTVDSSDLMRRKIMSVIKNAWLGPLDSPKYLRPYALRYSINGKEKSWELAKTHDSVAVLIYNTDRQVFVFVRQFRPAVFVRSEAAKCLEWSPKKPPQNEFSTEPGKTWELCAGIIDREDSPDNIAVAEIFEETGYKVSVSNLVKITKLVNGVGTSGSMQHIYFTEVKDEHRISQGGGLAEEGEVVEVMEVDKDQIESFAFDETKPKPPGCTMACLWWLNKYAVKDKVL